MREKIKNWKVEEISPVRSLKDCVSTWCCFHGGPVNNLTCNSANQFTIAKRLSNLENQNMEHKCLLETRDESFCSDSARAPRLIKLADCRSNIDDQSQTWHLSQLIGFIQEFEIILNRLGLTYDLSPGQLEGLWICEKHRNHFGKKTGARDAHASTRCIVVGRSNWRQETQSALTCQGK